MVQGRQQVPHMTGCRAGNKLGQVKAMVTTFGLVGETKGRQGAVLTLVLAVSVHCFMLSYVLSYAALCCLTCYLWYPMLSCAALWCCHVLPCMRTGGLP